jgi:hypothetical protein
MENISENIFALEKETEVWRDADGSTILTVSLEYPLLTKPGRAAKRINAFYTHRNVCFVKLCKENLLPVAAAKNPSAVRLKSKITFCNECCVSVLSDIVYGECYEPLRTADVWNLNTGTPFPVGELLKNAEVSRKTLKTGITMQISRFLNRGLVNLYPDAVKRAKHSLSLKNVYINSGGQLVLFFPQNTIAPRSEGFVQFIIKT